MAARVVELDVQAIEAAYANGDDPARDREALRGWDEHGVASVEGPPGRAPQAWVRERRAEGQRVNVVVSRDVVRNRLFAKHGDCRCLACKFVRGYVPSIDNSLLLEAGVRWDGFRYVATMVETATT